MRFLLLIFLFLSSVFSSIISKDVNGGSGTFLGLTYLKSSKTVLTAADSGGIKALKVDDSSLKLLGNVILTSGVRDVVSSKDETIVYAATNNSGLFVLDYSDPTSPQVVTSLPTTGQSIDLSIDVTNNLLAVAEDSAGVRIFDISTASLPVLKKRVETKKQVLKVFIKNETLVIGYLNGEVEIYDISGETTKKYTFNNFLSVNQLLEYQGNLLILDGTTGLYLYNIKRADVPVLLAAFPLANGVGLDFVENRFYVSTSSHNIYKLRYDNERFLFDFVEPVDENINELLVIDNKIVGTRFDKSVELLEERENNQCSNRVTFGKNPLTGNWSKFYSECDIPSGWLKRIDPPKELASKEVEALTQEDISSLGSGWHLLGTSKEITDLSVFTNVKSVWKYSNTNWSVYTAKSSQKERFLRSSYTPFDKIEAGMGFWIQND